MIIVPVAQVGNFRGASSAFFALDPQLLASGLEYVLPEVVLTDPGHLSRRSALSVLIKRVVAVGEFPWYDQALYPYSPTDNAETLALATIPAGQPGGDVVAHGN